MSVLKYPCMPFSISFCNLILFLWNGLNICHVSITLGLSLQHSKCTWKGPCGVWCPAFVPAMSQVELFVFLNLWIVHSGIRTQGLCRIAPALHKLILILVLYVVECWWGHMLLPEGPMGDLCWAGRAVINTPGETLFVSLPGFHFYLSHLYGVKD